MSDNLGPSAPGDEPEYLEPIAGDPVPRAASVSDPARGGNRRGALIGGGLVVAGLVGAGAWAATTFFATGAQPVDALPAGTLAYVSIDVEPSGEQQVEAYRFLKKFPAIRAELNLEDDTDLREELFAWAQEQGGCAEVDFAADVEPWLGTTAALAAVDLGADKIAPVLVLQVTDEEAAETGLGALRDCAGADDMGGWSIANGWAVVAEDATTAESVASATKSDPLGDDSDHAAWMDEVGDPGILSVYVAPNAPAALIGKAQSELPEAQSPMFGMYEDLYRDFPGMAGTLRFADAGLEFEAAGGQSVNGKELMGTGAGDSVSALPGDTGVAVGVSAGEGYVNQLMEQLALMATGLPDDGSGSDPVAQFEQQTGLALPEDLQTLLGDSFVFAVSGDLDMDAIANSSDGSDVPIGVKITGDAQAIEAVLDRVRVALGPYGEQFLASETSGDVVAVGPSADYRTALLSDGDLGESAVFTDAVGDVDDAGAVAFVDFGDWLDRAVAESGDPAGANLEPLEAIGFTSRIDDGVARFTLRVSTD